uniref:Large ribosomal subunit protein bL21m n=2 Tax=Timema TaxID=61471 RepID=A0A7R9APK9_TIMSH|nr:unnamed protein product [Timema shepardi]
MTMKFDPVVSPQLASTAQLCPPSLHRWLHWSSSVEKLSHQEEVIDTTTEDKQITKDVIARVNAQLEQQTQGRLFAVVHAGGKQFKVTPEDIIIVEGYWPPLFGDIITLDKVLLVGASDFTLIGRPILSPELVCVSATVIEKSLSHIKTHFRKKKRKQYMRINCEWLRALVWSTMSPGDYVWDTG